MDDSAEEFWQRQASKFAVCTQGHLAGQWLAATTEYPVTVSGSTHRDKKMRAAMKFWKVQFSIDRKKKTTQTSNCTMAIGFRAPASFGPRKVAA